LHAPRATDRRTDGPTDRRTEFSTLGTTAVVVGTKFSVMKFTLREFISTCIRNLMARFGNPIYLRRENRTRKFPSVRIFGGNGSQ
jgi:hypothetical protein